jgi:hypothetical protein
MAIDTRRVIMAAVEAALDDVMSAAPKPDKKKRRLPAGRALLLGAGIVTAARVATGSKSRELLGSVQDRLDSVQERLADYVEADATDG